MHNTNRKDKELQFLLQCAKEPTNKEAFSNDLDFERIIVLSEMNRLSGLLYKNFFESTFINEHVNNYFKSEYENYQKHGQFLYDCAQNLFQELNRLGIKAALLKGPQLVLDSFKDFGLRRFGDIDLYISTKDCDKVAELLFELGFVYGIITDGKLIKARRRDVIDSRLHTHQLFDFVRLEDGVRIDVNFLLSWKGPDCYKEPKADFEEMLMPYDNGFIKYRLKPIYLFIQLCTHMYNEMVFYKFKDKTSTGRARLFQAYDVFRYSKLINLASEETAAIVSRCNAKLQLWYALKLVNVLWGEQFPPELLSRFGTFDEVELMKYYEDHEFRISNACIWERYISKTFHMA